MKEWDRVRTVNGRLYTIRSTRTVHLRYEVAALPRGSQLSALGRNFGHVSAEACVQAAAW